jgi:hypothetical protein
LTATGENTRTAYFRGTARDFASEQFVHKPPKKEINLRCGLFQKNIQRNFQLLKCFFQPQH